ncbi:hypothetical protein HYH03_008779 [Edaphochlamys debaryana]|uniref:GRF-type domain-containing protein n=1 Tax=Edaphochlamys debaryana TaxID=47281 RepID=A0A835Y2F3_9CHLO|nr:hypothetical protein HYH03_008779 [Edaphochlamys debaryana]|eukprot:KAG2492861.1 hypothetical protein HYH03_008779 [Edaphochlamys debaryana]
MMTRPYAPFSSWLCFLAPERICLETECGWRKLPRPPYLRRWCNLKRLYTARYRRTASLQKCVEAVGLRWEGRLHSGLDDARNTAALAVRMVRDGVVLRTTDSFKEAPTAGAPGGPAGPAGPGSGVKEAAGPGGPAGPTGPEAAGPAGSGSAAAAPSPFGAGSPGSAPREGAEADVGAGAGAGAGSQTCVERSAGGEAGPSPSGRARAAGAGGGGGGGGLRQAVITLTPASSPGLAAPSGAGPSGSASPSQASPSGGGGGGGGGGMTAVAVGSAPPALYDGEGRWLGRCRCGVPANLRTAKKPGANQGRQFYSCGRWSISDRARAVCGFFAWAEGLRLAPGAVTPGGGAGGRGGKRKQ